ncbi:MAG: glycosyltransferase family 2 protein [Actinomycetota bacterium]|jgi:glycosyltransferase involved in cell wall biosynthesis|nr:glycosyltransferase family 2 protein [Actinomycetota bacterium]MCL6092864.1 glycosyltransferase family 2 protein [Actinomycetota bacterium]MDA8166434.1 glycosyltransferase family 2 protein [Actinomycetota bacterium]
MKLVIMIPCLNEEKTLSLVLETIPKEIPGIDTIDVLVIDDGSTDQTVAVAKQLGVKHFIHHARNRGLALSLREGIRGALELKADILVLTDGDNQYPQERIPDLIRPILDGAADTVIADRQVRTIEHFSPMKKFLQKFGTGVLNAAAGTSIPDSTSGFRAYSREAATKLNLIGKFNFAMETTLQAAQKRMNIATIPITTNPKTRESRLFKSSWEHVRKSAVALINAYIMYKPFMVFMTLGIILLIGGLVPFVHFLYLTLTTGNAFGAHHLQSLIIGGVLLTGSFFSFTLGIIANLIRINRILIEDVLEELRRERYGMLVEETIDDQ